MAGMCSEAVPETFPRHVSGRKFSAATKAVQCAPKVSGKTTPRAVERRPSRSAAWLTGMNEFQKIAAGESRSASGWQLAAPRFASSARVGRLFAGAAFFPSAIRILAPLTLAKHLRNLLVALPGVPATSSGVTPKSRPKGPSRQFAVAEVRVTGRIA
jgi:hypothetical protein